jgi:hypothetical protein
MKSENFPRNNPFEVSGNFFREQEEGILNKTSEIENWSVPGTRKAEEIFPLPNGYWLTMEDGIRNKISSHQKSWLPASLLGFKPALATAFSLSIVLVFAGIWFFRPAKQSDNWTAHLDQVSESEMLAYMESRPRPELQEITENLAFQTLNESEIVAPDLKISDQELEENLEQINENELLQNSETF